jgi:hypothetical protein
VCQMVFHGGGFSPDYSDLSIITFWHQENCIDILPKVVMPDGARS